MDEAILYVNTFYPNIMPEILNYKAQSGPFKQYLFTEHTVQNMKPLIWWLALRHHISPELLNLIKQLHTAVASSAGIERLFSTFGFVHSKARNRLGTEKAAKLVSVFKTLNQNIDFGPTPD